MSRPNKKALETLEILQNEQNSNNSSPSDDDDIIEAPKITKTQKPRTDKQIETTNKMRERLKAAQEQRKLKKQMEEEENKKRLEEKIIKKAISIKKKQIKKQKVLDDISDDETPLEEIKKIVKQPVRRAPKNDAEIYQSPPQQPQKPQLKYIFI